MFLKLNPKSVSLLDRNRKSVRNLQYAQFPKMYKTYLDTTRCKSTHYVECLGKEILANHATVSNGLVYEFVRLVCWWGGPLTLLVFARLPKLNGGKRQAKQKVAQAVKNAASYLPDIKLALRELHNVKGFQSISMPSKILRMLLPEKAACFDDVLQQEFGFTKIISDSEYKTWCDECVSLAKLIKISNLKRHNHVWYAADVEGSIYREVNP